MQHNCSWPLTETIQMINSCPQIGWEFDRGYWAERLICSGPNQTKFVLKNKDIGVSWELRMASLELGTPYLFHMLWQKSNPREVYNE